MNHQAEIVETELMTKREIAEERLRKTIKTLQSTLEYQIEYCEDIVRCLDKDREIINSYGHILEDWYSNEVDDNLDYLIRDLVPEYQNQDGAIDTLVNALKTIQQYRKKIIQENE